MADDTPKGQKTRAIGTLPASKAKELKGWAKYDATAKALSKARTESEEAKDAIRAALVPIATAALKARKQTLEGELDFTVEKDGTVRIFENLERKGRVRASDLSEFL